MFPGMKWGDYGIAAIYVGRCGPTGGVLMDEIREEWYIHLIDELQDIITETVFTHSWALVEGYHMVGTRILQEYDNFQRLRMPDKDLIETVATSLGKKSRTIYYAIQFARKYPDLNLLPEGKNVNWHHIVNKYLTDGKETKTVKKKDILDMLYQVKVLLERERVKAYNDFSNESEFKSRYEFICFLQDEFDVITKEVKL